MQAAGEELPPEDPRAFMQSVFRDGLLPALRTSPIVFRAFLRWFNLLSTPDALMSDPEIVNEVLAAYQDRENHPAPEPFGPADRAEFVALQLRARAHAAVSRRGGRCRSRAMSATCGRIAFSSVGSYATGRVGRREPPHRCVEVLEALVGDERGDLGTEAARERVLVHDEHAAGLAHRLGDDVAVPRRDRAQVDDLDAGVVAELLRGLLGAVHRRAPRDDRDAVAAAARRCRDRTAASSRRAASGRGCGPGGRGACARGTAPGPRSGTRCAAGRPRRARATGTRSGARGCGRRSTRRTGCARSRRPAGSRRSGCARPSGTRTRRSSASASSRPPTSAGSSPATRSRRTGSPGTGASRASPGRPRAR